jgi:hypothetical protein
MTLSFFDDDDARQQQQQQSSVVFLFFFAKKNVFVLNFQNTKEHKLWSDDDDFFRLCFFLKSDVSERKGLKRTPKNTLFLLILLLLSSGATKNSFRGALKALLFS